MARLRLAPILLAAALSCASPAAADAVANPVANSVDRWSHHIAEASARFGVPETWIRRVMHAESGGRTNHAGRPIVSRAGAMGLMQLMPGTWREMRAALELGHDPHEPRDNILAGTFYLRLMHDRFGYPGLFAAYNAGPARYAAHLATGRRLPAETVAYVAKVASSGPPAQGTGPGAPAHPPLFAVGAAARPASDGGEAAVAARDRLFVLLRAGDGSRPAAPGGEGADAKGTGVSR